MKIIKSTYCYIIILLVFPFIGNAQEYVYTLYPFAPINYNPSFVGIDNRASIGFLHQETEVGAGVNVANNLLTGEYPIVNKNGRRYGGIGLTLIERDAGSSDLLNTVSAGLSLAYNLQIANNQFISLGLKGTYFNKKTSLESLTSGSQWLATEFRFDPNAAIGETIAEQNVGYLGLDAGITWYLTDRIDEQKAFFGVSLLSLNKPNDSFFASQSEIPTSLLVNTGFILFESDRVRFTPQLFYQKEQNLNIYNFILSTKFLINNSNPYDIIKSGDLELLARYDFNRDAAIGLIFNQPNLSVGFSYNFPTSNQTEFQYIQGGSEFGITLSKSLWKPKPKVITIQDQSQNYQRDFYFEKGTDKKPADTEQIVTQKSEIDQIKEKIESFNEVSSFQFELNKDFKFPFNESTLHEEAKQFIRELYTLFQNNENFNLEIVGHTDNVGKPIVNYKLSQERANAVAEYLISLGLSKEKIKTSGKGDTEPLFMNENEEARGRNRRVEFIIFVDKTK